jgi:MFS transporter, YNFM family, putative membrane transport protein
MTTTLLGFAAAGLLPERHPRRTMRIALVATVAGSLLAAGSFALWLLLAARVLQGLGIGLLLAGALADIPRRLPPGGRGGLPHQNKHAGRMTGSLVAGTALGGLGGRAIGYVGLFATWRAAFLLGGLGALVLVWVGLRALPLGGAPQTARPGYEGRRAPASLLVAGLFILFANVAIFDLLPYRLAAPPFHLPDYLADLVFAVYVPASLVSMLAGRAVDRFGERAVTLATSAVAAVALAAGLLPSLAGVIVAAGASIWGTIAFQVAHSGAAAAYGRAAVGRYLAVYYVGGALGAPLAGATYLRWGWTGSLVPLIAATAAVGALALTRAPLTQAAQQADGAQGE